MTVGEGTQGIVVVVDDMEEAVGTLLTAVEDTIEAQPLGTCQRCRLHILCALYEGDVYLLESAIAAAVLKGGEEDGVRTAVDDLLDDGTHAFADIGYVSEGYLFMNPRYLDVLQVGNASDALLTVKRQEHGAMDGGKDHRTAQGRADNGPFGQRRGQRTVGRDEEVTVEYSTVLPRIFQHGLGIAIIAYYTQKGGVLETNGIATSLHARALTPAAGGKQ